MARSARGAARQRPPSRQDTGPTRPTVLKLGGELLEQPRRLRRLADAIVRLADDAPLVVVHGGGREVDAELARHGIGKRSIDGIRITDVPTLSIVVAVLAGSVNTRLVAAVVTGGARAVGLTGVDSALGLVEPAPAHRTVTGRRVALGRVGRPVSNGPPRLLVDLCRQGYVPIVASIGIAKSGRLFNVNADTLAGHLASALGAARLLIAGTTPGVLDSRRRTIRRLDEEGIRALIAEGHAHAGMVAKLRACQEALRGGVGDVIVADGRAPGRLGRVGGTQIVAEPRRAASRAHPLGARRTSTAAVRRQRNGTFTRG